MQCITHQMPSALIDKSRIPFLPRVPILADPTLHQPGDIDILIFMRAGGFTLSKWASNNNALLQCIPENQREVNCPLEIHADVIIKTIGLAWNPSLDCFQYRVVQPIEHTEPTKRVVLSEIASLFDPLGLLAPTIVAAKIFMQTLWAEGVSWDEPLPPSLADRWQTFRNDLPSLNALNIPRWLGTHGSHTHQLHGFCDASESAYAAVVYLSAVDDRGQTTVRLITARTKVAPVKKVSLPRLELCGAVLLANLLAYVKACLDWPDVECRAWCDSTITIAWIRKPSHCWQTFVANRVSAIQTLTAPEIWQHVPGNDNPADSASRGITASSLAKSYLWWHGPSWLVRDSTNWPQSSNDYNTKIDEKKIVASCLHISAGDMDILHRFSSFNRLQRVTAYMQRFVWNARNPKSLRKSGTITTIELFSATQHWVRATQAAEYSTEISRCRCGATVPTKSALISLHPFLDDARMLRVGGRVGSAKIPYNARHPIILPRKCAADTSVPVRWRGLRRSHHH